MNEQKFTALVRLLDDTDPEVLSQVEGEILSLGDQAVPRLQSVMDELEDESLQNRVNELIGRIQLEQISDELLQWRKKGGKDLLEAWVLVSQVADPTMNTQKYRDAVSRLVHRTFLQIKPGMSQLEKLCVVNKLFYGIEGFSGNYLNPKKSENNLIGYVLDNKTGNSLSLSMLYAIVAGSLGVTVQVVNFKGYYALRYYSKDQHFYVDAYNKGLFFTPQQVQRFLAKLGAEDNVKHYKSLTNTYVILHLIETIIATLEQEEDYSTAERFRKLSENIEISFDDDPIT